MNTSMAFQQLNEDELQNIDGGFIGWIIFAAALVAAVVTIVCPPASQPMWKTLTKAGGIAIGGAATGAMAELSGY